MDKKKKTAIIIAAIIVIAAVAVTVVLATNKKDDPIYEDTYVAVTDENGDVVFDKDGNVVTELASKPVSSTEKTTAPKNNKTTAKSSTTSSGKTDSNNNGNNNNNSDAKDDTTKKPTETQTEKKPEKRDVTLEIHLPYYYDPAKNAPRECELTVNVCIDGEWNKIDLNDYNFTITGGDNKNNDDDVKDGKIKLDRATITIELGKIKGDVEAAVDITNVTALKNSSSVDEFGDKIVISPVTGVESMEGIDD